MRYYKYKITLDETSDRCASAWGGNPTYWFEINDHGDANRQIVYYPNGNTISYDCSHQYDDYNGLQEMVVDGDEDYWIPYSISKEDFEHEWSLHIAMNRINEYKDRLTAAKLEQRPDIVDEPLF